MNLKRTRIYRIPMSGTVLREKHRVFFRKMTRYMERYRRLIGSGA